MVTGCRDQPGVHTARLPAPGGTLHTSPLPATQRLLLILWPHSEPTARACAGREPWRRCEAVHVGLHAPAPSQPGSELTPGGGNLRSVRSFVRFNISVYLNSWKCECLISISPSKINSGISPKKGEEKKLLRKLKNLNRLSL